MAWDDIMVAGQVIASADYNARTTLIKKALGAEDVVTFVDGDVTPLVAGATLFETANSAPTDITDFIGATEKLINILFGDAFTTIKSTDSGNANIRLMGGADYVSQDGYSLTLRYRDDNIWHEESRSLNT